MTANLSAPCEGCRARIEGSDRVEFQDAVIGISCFLVAPPFRGHGLHEALLERVLADAARRGAEWVEAYPPSQEGDGPSGFLGRRALYERHGFEAVRPEGSRQLVVRRPVD